MPVSAPLKAFVLASATLAGLASARAADVTPWSKDACAAFAKQASDALRLPVKTSEGDPKSVREEAPSGRACLFTADGTGVTQTFDQAEGRLAKALDGWTQILELSADGPDSTSQGYAKDNRQVLVTLERAPPPGTCENVVQVDCKQPAKRWRWTFKAAAYQK